MSDTIKNDNLLLLKLQQGIPLVPRPFAELGQSVDLTEQQVLDSINRFFELGKARRMGGVFDARKLGYRSMLCAVDLPGKDTSHLTQVLIDHPGITHCYRRPRTKIFPYDLYAMIHDQSWQKVHQLFLDISEKTKLDNGRFLCSTKEYKKTSMSYFTT